MAIIGRATSLLISAILFAAVSSPSAAVQPGFFSEWVNRQGGLINNLVSQLGSTTPGTPSVGGGGGGGGGNAGPPNPLEVAFPGILGAVSSPLKDTSNPLGAAIQSNPLIADTVGEIAPELLPSESPSPTPSATPSSTPSATPSISPTPSSSPSSSPSPSPSPSPAELSFLEDLLGSPTL